MSLLPQNKQSEVCEWQGKLLDTARELLNNVEIPVSSCIDYDSKDLWQEIDFVIVSMLSAKIKNAEKIEVLTADLNDCGESHLFDLLNSFYNFLTYANISYKAAKIFPNQDGVFCTIGDLKKEEGSIDDILKKDSGVQDAIDKVLSYFTDSKAGQEFIDGILNERRVVDNT